MWRQCNKKDQLARGDISWWWLDKEKEMNTENVACEIVDKMLNELYDRTGFSDWWDSIDVDVQQEIEDSLVSIVENILD